jgi:hypothetical protein
VTRPPECAELRISEVAVLWPAVDASWPRGTGEHAEIESVLMMSTRAGGE